MNVKALLRWILRRDAGASNTRMAGWITKVEVFFPTVIGVTYGIWIGLAVFGFMWILRTIIGYLDIRYLKVTAYTNDYITSVAPSNVKVLDNKKRKKGVHV